MRTAALASTYDCDFNSEPVFIIDADLHPGTNAAPIITPPSLQLIDFRSGMITISHEPYFLVGVNTEPVQKHGRFLWLHKAFYSGLFEEIPRNPH